MLYPTREFVIPFEHERNPFKEDDIDLGKKKITQKGDTKILFMSYIASLEFTCLLLLFEYLLPGLTRKRNYTRRIRQFRVKYYAKRSRRILWRVTMICLILIVLHQVQVPHTEPTVVGKSNQNNFFSEVLKHQVFSKDF